MRTAVLVPILKDKSGDLCCKNNFRPIGLSSMLTKVLENIIIGRIEPYLITSCNQFGFKSKHSTDMCVMLLIEILHYHKLHNTSSFVCFLDATKAFDRVNHSVLFTKLKEKMYHYILLDYYITGIITNVFL